MESQEQQKYIYTLYYKAESLNDCLNLESNFTNSNDDSARELALSFIEYYNREERRKIEDKVSDLEKFRIYKPLKLERITYDIKEIVEKIEIPLKKIPAHEEKGDAQTKQSKWDYSTLL